MFAVFLLIGAGIAVIGNRTGTPMAVLGGVVLVALTLLVGWLRRPHQIGRDGRWTCARGHSTPASRHRCGACQSMGRSGRH